VDAAQLPAPQLGRILIAAGLLTEEQLAQALEEQSRTGSRLGEIIVQRGFISGPALANALAEQHGGVLKTEYGFATGLGGEAVKRAASEGSSEPLDSQLRTDPPASIPQLRTAQPQAPQAQPAPPAPEEPVAPEQPVQPAEWPESAQPPAEPQQSEPQAPPPLRTAEPPTENPEVEVAAASPPPLAEPLLEMPPLLAQAQVEPEPVPTLELEPTPFAEAEEPVPEPVELHVPLAEPVQESSPPLELPPPPEPEPAPLAEAAEPVPEPVELRPPVAEPAQVAPSVPEPVAVEPVQEISPLPELPLLSEPQPAPTAEAVEPVQEAAPEPEPRPEPVSHEDDRDALIESLHARLEAREQEVAKLRAELDEERSRAVQVHVWPEDQPESPPPPAQKEQYLLCVPTPAGYVLLDRVGPLPSVGQSVAVPEEEGSFTVTKVVRLPRNGRPCAYLQRA
jgi:hypothetical protein